MPLALNPADRRPLLAGGSVFLLLVVVGLLLAPTTDSDLPTSYSAASGGSKAAFLLLETLGYRTSRWERAPAALTSPETTTIIVAEPMAIEQDDRDAMLRFVEAGGRLVVTGPAGAALAGLNGRGAPAATLGWTRASAVSLSRITRAAPAITLAPATHLSSPLLGMPLYAIDDEPAVVHVRRKRGDVYWWTSATPLTNAGITATGNLPFLLASLGEPAGRVVLFDEYFHGYRETLAQSLLASPVKWVMAQVGLLAALLLATYARRSGPIVPGPRDTRLSPLEFVHTMGELYRRARAGSMAVSVAYAPFRTALMTRYGIPRSADALTAAAAIATRRGGDSATLAETLRACEAARDDLNLRDVDALGIVQALHDRSTELGLRLPSRETR